MEAFWTIASYAVVLGIPALIGYLIYYYWFVVLRRDDKESKTE